MLVQRNILIGLKILGKWRRGKEKAKRKTIRNTLDEVPAFTKLKIKLIQTSPAKAVISGNFLIKFLKFLVVCFFIALVHCYSEILIFPGKLV